MTGKGNRGFSSARKEGAELFYLTGTGDKGFIGRELVTSR